MRARESHSPPTVLVLTLLLVLLAAAPAVAVTPAELEAEILGLSEEPTGPPGTRATQGATLPPGGLLLIPESTNDRVMAFDPMTGDLVDADFIPSDPTNLSTPIHAVLSSDGASVLVSDQLDDVVQQYDLSGTYIGVFAPAGGADTSILDNIRGIAIRSSDGHLLVSVGGGANDDAIAEFDTSGNYVGNFVANGSDGLDSPFDVYERSADFLVGGITSDVIHSYDAAGSPNPQFAPIDGFPEQIGEALNGNVLVANFTGTQEGVVEFDATGTVVDIYDPASLGGYRGVYELPNGNILTTNGSGVHEIDRTGALVETKISGVSARFIQLVGAAAPTGTTSLEDIPTLHGTSLAALVLLLGLAGAMLLGRTRS